MKHKDEINELWNYSDSLRDFKDRSRHDNLRIGRLDEVENVTWEQTEVILQKALDQKLELPSIKVERRH